MGWDVGLTAPTPPTPRSYCALKACRNCHRETCGRFRAAENPRLGPGVGVAGPRPAATSRRARGLAGFLAKTARLTKAGSQLPACQDRKLTELLDSYPTSKPNQLRGLLSE